MSEMRKQFEALPEIERHVKYGFIEFIGNHYFLPEHVKSVGSQAFLIHKHNVTWINGAWYAFQEQQKKIDLFNKMILSLRNEFNLWADDTESFNAIEAQIENLEELLK